MRSRGSSWWTATPASSERAQSSQHEASHLEACPACRATLATLQLMAEELLVARHSEPSPDLRVRAYRFFAQIQQQPSWIERIVQRLQAQLIWDSRHQLATQGLRTTVTDRYHLLYTTDRVEVELSVQPQAGHFNLDGELLPLESDAVLTPALVHLELADGSGVTHEIYSDDKGHFRFEGLAPGQFILLITPRTGVLLEIEGLALS